MKYFDWDPEKNIQLYTLPRRPGGNIGIIAGLDHALGDFTVMMHPRYAPPELIPQMVDLVLAGADVVYALRVQSERGANGFIPTLREYSKMFGISRKRLDLAKKDAILMHPGPVIRDIDVHSALAAVDEQSYILRQVENGMAVRKSLLWLLCDRADGKTKTFTRK